jgi:hypothetical protein
MSIGSWIFAAIIISLLVSILIKLRSILYHIQAPYSGPERYMEYVTVGKHPDDLGDFTRAVNEMIKDSWKPLGGIAVLENGGWVQAMVKVYYKQR